MAVIFLKLRHRNRIDARKKWGPIRRGGGFAPYERFRLWRKPWRRANSFCPSILITEGWSRLSGGGTQKERLASGVSFFLVDPRRIELPNLSDANQTRKLFSIIFSYFWPFSFHSAYSLNILDHAVSAYYGGVCGGSCGQRHSPALSGAFTDRDEGSFFMQLYCLDCNSEDRIKQVIFAPSTAQELGGCKQKKQISKRRTFVAQKRQI